MKSPLHSKSSVLAVVTHYQCEAWLAQAIESLVKQTRPPDAIVVVDDASVEAPTDIVRKFPGVTLLQAEQNVGPYRLIQTIIEHTHYDAYLQQDSDDWSRSERLALLLAEAERTGAEFLGTASANIRSRGFEDVPELKSHPADVNAAFLENSDGWFLSWGTSIVSRDLVLRLGGLAGLRFGGDVEFTCRAHYAARVVNLQRCCYDRRKRQNSLTTSSDTGIESPQRKQTRHQISVRNFENAAAVSAGKLPNLEPLVAAEPVRLIHMLGPSLLGFPVNEGIAK